MQKHYVWISSGLVLLIFALWLILSSHAKAHSWYDPWCCNDRDCKKVDSVINTPNGVAVQVDGKIIPIPDSVERKYSQDQFTHVCYMVQPDNTITVRCFYIPGGN